MEGGGGVRGGFSLFTGQKIAEIRKFYLDSGGGEGFLITGQGYVRTCVVRTYVSTYIRTYVRTYVRTCVRTCVRTVPGLPKQKQLTF